MADWFVRIGGLVNGGVHSRQRPRALHVDHRGSAAEVSVRVVEPEGAGHPLHQRQ
jgi:hypothetical protein